VPLSLTFSSLASDDIDLTKSNLYTTGAIIFFSIILIIGIPIFATRTDFGFGTSIWCLLVINQLVLISNIRRLLQFYFSKKKASTFKKNKIFSLLHLKKISMLLWLSTFFLIIVVLSIIMIDNASVVNNI